jgi:nucleoside-diphosphate-sugar epimerase
MSRVFITGGAGYIGSILCEHLLDAGYHVDVVDRLIYGQNSLFHLCANPRFNFSYGDARDEQTIKEYLKKADVIIPLAAIVGASACKFDSWAARSTNYDAIKLINNLRTKNQLLIYPNTNSGYGTKSGDTLCTEDTPMEPISLYGETKVQAEYELLQSENVITFRLATVFGMSPRMRIDLLVNHFVYAALFDGYIIIFEKDFKRNYVHIRDVADAFIFGLKNREKMIGKPYNLGLDNANLSKAELAEKVKEFVQNFYIHYSEIGSDPDKRNYIVSNERLLKAGFKAQRSLDEGIP